MAGASDCDGRSSWRVPGLRLPRAREQSGGSEARADGDWRPTSGEQWVWDVRPVSPARTAPRSWGAGYNVGRLPPGRSPTSAGPGARAERGPRPPESTPGPPRPRRRKDENRGGGTRRGHCRDPVRRATPQLHPALLKGPARVSGATDAPGVVSTLRGRPAAAQAVKNCRPGEQGRRSASRRCLHGSGDGAAR